MQNKLHTSYLSDIIWHWPILGKDILRGVPMLRAAILFFILAVVALALGLGGIAGLSMEIARILIGVFIILAIISGLVHIFRGRGK